MLSLVVLASFAVVVLICIEMWRFIKKVRRRQVEVEVEENGNDVREICELLRRNQQALMTNQQELMENVQEIILKLNIVKAGQLDSRGLQVSMC